MMRYYKTLLFQSVKHLTKYNYLCYNESIARVVLVSSLKPYFMGCPMKNFVKLMEVVVMASPMTWLLNYLLSDTATSAIFGTPEVSYWQGLWLNVFLVIFIRCSRSSCNCS